MRSALQAMALGLSQMVPLGAGLEYMVPRRTMSDGPRFRPRRPSVRSNRPQLTREQQQQLMDAAAKRREHRKRKAWLDCFARDMGYHPAARALARAASEARMLAEEARALLPMVWR